MNNNQTSIIVYRSKTEQAQDEFIQDNPELVLGGVGLLVLIVIIYWAKNKFFR